MDAKPAPLGVRLALLACLLLGLLFTGLRARRLDLGNAQTRREVLTPLDAENSVGQSFVAAQDGFFSLTLYPHFRTAEPGWVPLTIHLRRSTEDQTDLAVSHLLVSDLTAGDSLDVFLPVQAHSAGQEYYILIQAQAEPGQLALWSSASQAYRAGQLRQNGQPVEGDLAFAAYLRPGLAGLAAAFMPDWQRFAWLAGLAAGLAAVGGLLLGLFPLPRPGSWVEWAAPALALGLAFAPVLMYSLSLLRIPLTLNWLAGSLLALLACNAALYVFRWRRLSKPDLASPAAAASPARASRWFGLLELCVLCLAGVTRVLQVHGLSAPLWFDGLAHQQILDGIIRHGGMLSARALYHQGFHSLVYALGLVTGDLGPQAILLTGQLLSACAGLTFLYLLKRLGFRPYDALLGANFYLFFAPFPAYLTTWSRFPFLLGLVLLPVVIVASLDWLVRRSSNFVLPALLLAGLALSHYGSVVIWAAFLLSVWTWKKLAPRLGLASEGGLLDPAEPIDIRRILAVLGVIAVLWAPRLVALLANQRWARLADQAQVNQGSIDYWHTFALTFTQGGALLWGLSALGGLAAWFQRRARFALVLTWLGLTGLATWLQWAFLGMALSGYNNLLILLSFATALLATAGLSALRLDQTPAPGSTSRLPASRAGQVFQPRWALLALLLAVGSYSIVGIVNPLTVLAGPYDQAAYAWIMRSTPPDAVFLAPSSRWNADYVPSDGGGWIPAFTGRKIVYPTSKAEYADLPSFLAAHPFDYLYLGQGVGSAEQEALRSLIDQYRLVYQAGEVEILQPP